MERLIAVSFALISLLVQPATAEEIRHTSHFSIKFGVLEVGRAKFEISHNDKVYELSGSGKTSGLAEWFSPTKGNFKSMGMLDEARLNPSKYQISVKEKAKPKESVQLSFSNNLVTDIDVISNKKRKKKGRKNFIPLTENHKRDVIDPISSLLVPVTSKSLGNGQEICDRRFPIFDGETRYDIRLYYKSNKAVKTSGFDGKAYVCQMRYVPVAGHRKNHRNVKKMANNKDMEVWLAPIASGDMFTPIKFIIRTEYGIFTANPLHFGEAKS